MKKKILFLVLSIFIVILILFSSSYALLFKTNVTDKQSYTTGILDITSEALNGSVTLSNELPMTDSDGENTTPYVFRITNTGNLSYKFNIMLLSTTTENQIESEYIKIKVDDNTPVKLNSLTNGVILSEILLEPTEYVDITLRVWLDEYTPNTQIGKTFNAKITTEGQAIYVDSSIPPEEMLQGAESNMGPTTLFLGSAIARQDIESIEFIKKSMIPSGVSDPVDVSYDKVNHPNQVELYYIKNNETNLYKIYIATKSGKVLLSSGEGIFSYLLKNTSINLDKVYTNNVTSMGFMFALSPTLKEVDLRNFDTSEVTNMSYMFYGCVSLTSIDVSSFNTSKVTNMHGMFAGDYEYYYYDYNDGSYMSFKYMSFKSIDLSSFDTSQVTDMSYMFADNFSLLNLDLSNFNTSKVTDMSFMFKECRELQTLNISNFDTSQVINMSYMFFYTSLYSLDLSSFDTSQVTDMSSMFCYSEVLSTIYVSNKFVTTNVTNSTDMFDICSQLVGGNGTKYISCSPDESGCTSTPTDKTYARIDTTSTPGYFTLKA